MENWMVYKMVEESVPELVLKLVHMLGFLSLRKKDKWMI